MSDKLDIIRHREGHEVLDYDRYLQHLISVIANRLTSYSSSQYLSQFGLGSVEMRVLASLAYQPNQKAAEVCSLISIDKAAASRAMAKLDSQNLLIGETATPKGKQKRWSLSEKGWALHQRFLDVVLDRHERVVKEIDESELVQFVGTLHKLIKNIETLDTE
ncbi:MULTISPECIES: MarR family winged helix-turn-helix transcriptional regulator [unclassified Marinobacterium]|jgi:DNA-binding MarR family transcriptional regulator|uniref:MarR family winged helix-turn-helix transcriptional regulator n=1 Tax=unclassified Marinobacterium TaxID=2644139 RepID=UPI0015685A50|nr:MULTISPECIES: MarR family winged helix-turn-helix transcriptional regulator [unclassified Marinobacterium]NRP10573.1 transcriptional regulator SlyA [Marinobacterium sp. xm-g-48]NRP15827.1 transcriptional regulator SlyA [Marinobacterium sp. xm-a-152]NRP38779.1 transcriptional regulator SlyA [Marinobacterium sp. xm-a-121]NRP51645.1 transcriptional regulator SlyA [Marinobacterium sp. xm-v-242]NRP57894.1 transcriptional regulator SlyA [Marinobacterium sp. xm-d-510]